MEQQPSPFRLVRRNWWLSLCLALLVYMNVARPIVAELPPFAAWLFGAGLVAALSWYCVHARVVVELDASAELLTLTRHGLWRSVDRVELAQVSRAELTSDVENNAELVFHLKSGERRSFGAPSLASMSDCRAILRAVEDAIAPRNAAPPPPAPVPPAPLPPARPPSAQALRVGALLSASVPDEREDQIAARAG